MANRGMEYALELAAFLACLRGALWFQGDGDPLTGGALLIAGFYFLLGMLYDASADIWGRLH